MDASAYFALILAGLLVTFWLLLRHQIKTANEETREKLMDAFRQELAAALRKGHGYPTAPVEDARPTGEVVDEETCILDRESIFGMDDVPTLVSEGVAPPASDKRPVPLERAAKLDAATLARVDALAAERGLTRAAMLEIIYRSGLNPPPSGPHEK